MAQQDYLKYNISHPEKICIKDKNDIKLGDFLVTSGSAKIFPKDILVGKVVKINENEFIAVPFVDFKNLDYVQIVDR